MSKLLCILFLLFGMILSPIKPVDAAEIDYTTGTPWPNIDLDGVVTPDMNASVKDNYALAVNKDKILAIKIPEGYSFGGTVMDIVLKNNEDIKKMFLGKAPQNHDAKLAYDLFHLMMDWNGRNAVGMTPLKKATDTVEAINSIDALNKYFIKTPVEDQLDAPWDFGSDVDFNDSDHYIMIISYPSLVLKDSAEYSNLTDYGAIKKKAAVELLQKMLVKLGYSEKDAAQKIENCFAFETMIAPTIHTNEQQQGADFMSLINNRYSYEKLAKAQGKIPILPVIKRVGYPNSKEYIVSSPEFLTKLNELYTQENLQLIKDYMIVHGAFSAASLLDRECYEWDLAYQNAITGASGMLPDDEIFSAVVSGILKWPVARLYTERYLNQSDKERITALTDRIIDAYHGIINEADFLSDATKANAIAKLDAIDKRILYPDSWEKYDCKNLNFVSAREGGTLWQAMKKIKAYTVAKSVKEYSKPVDKDEWGATPQTVNAFYYPQTNSIYILGAYALGMLRNSDMSEEELLGNLGTVIGHEISHAFDSTGAQFDKNGNMKNWWTEEDYAAFRARNDKMIAYYNNMHPWAGQNFYGSTMTGEAGADMTGMKVVLRLAAENKNFDYDKFFRAFANDWLVKDTLQEAYVRINDTHPMCYLRINCTLQQFDEFLNFYGITEGDGMYLAPKDRVIIW